MRVTIVGTINKDLILPFNHAPIESFGGIFYNVSVMSELLPDDAEITPVSYVGEDISEVVRVVLQKRPNVRLNGLVSLDQKNHKVILEYMTPEKREEKSLFQFPQLQWEHIEPHLDADMILLNLISGWDISFAAFEQLKKIAGDRLYVDIHYLLMGLDTIGRRFPKLPDNIRGWLAGPRFVQMNEQEFQLIAGNITDEAAFHKKYLDHEQILVSTRSNRGVMAVYHHGGFLVKKLYNAYKPTQIIDSTGCGDTFGSAFVADYLSSGDIGSATDFANRAAAANLMLQGTNEMHRLRETMMQLQLDEISPR